MTAIIKTGGRFTIGAGGIAQIGTSSLLVPPPTVNDTGINAQSFHYELNDANTGGLITYRTSSTQYVRELTISGSTVTVGSEVTKDTGVTTASTNRGFVRRYQSGGTPNYIAISVDNAASASITARAFNSSAVAQTTDTTIDTAASFNRANFGSRKDGGTQMMVFAQDSGGIQYYVVTESGGSISVQNSGTVVSSGTPSLVNATDGVTDGRGLLLNSVNPGPGPVLRAYSITGNDYSESSTLVIGSTTSSTGAVNQVAAISTDIGLVLFWNGSEWTLRKVTGVEGTLALSGSELTPVPGHSSSHSIVITRLNNTQALLGWSDGNDLKYQAVDCSGASPVLTGDVKTLTRSASMDFAFAVQGGWNGHWQYMSDGNVMASWVESGDLRFAILNDL